MVRLRRVFTVLAALSLLFVVLLVALELALPRLVSLDAVRQMALSTLQDYVAGEVSFESMDVSLLPRPHLTAHSLVVSRPDGSAADVESVRVTVDALPLFRGQLRMSRVRLSNPKLTVPLRRNGSGEQLTLGEEVGALTHGGMRRGFVGVLAPAVSMPEGLVVTMENGELDLQIDGQQAAHFDKIAARLVRHGKEVRLAYSCGSNLWRSVSSEGFFELDTFKGRSYTSVVGLNPDVLSQILYPENPLSFPEHEMNLSVLLVSGGPAELDLSFRTAVPRLGLKVGDRTTFLKEASLDGGIALRPDGFKLTLDSLKTKVPALSVTGTVSYDPQTARISADVHGTDVDAGGVRELMLVLAGKSRGVIKTFEVVKGGRVPQIRAQVQDKTLDELGELENVTITGSMVDGRIYIEPADLEVEGATGDAVIEGGILEGRRLQAHTGATTGHDGSLTLALEKDPSGDGPFHLDIAVDADLSRLPAVLLHAVKDKDFLVELNRMSEIEGRAKGRLVLGETVKDVKTKVDAREFNLQGKYQRTPFPIEVKGKALVFEGKSIAINGFEGSLGGSSWTPLDVSIDWGPSSRIQIQSESPAQIFLDQMFPWLTSFPRVKRGLPDIQNLKGMVTLQSAQLEGPLYEPAKWKYEVKGDFNQGTVESPFFPGPVTVKSSKLLGAPSVLTLSECEASLLDAAVSMSVALKTQSGLMAADLTFAEAEVGPKATQWVVDLIGLPQEFRPKPPLSLVKSRFVWERNGRVSFEGNLSQPSGVRTSIEYMRGRDQWSINRLTVKDQLSDGALKATVRERDLDLAFQGRLEGKTLDQLLEKNDLLKGGVTGDLRLNVFVEEPVRSTATGVLDLSGFHSLWKFRAPVRIDRASLDAQGGRLTIKSADVVYEGSPLHLSGNLSFAPHGLAMDMAVSSESYVWMTDAATEEGSSGEKGSGSGPGTVSTEILNPRFMGLALTGVLKVELDRLEYGKYVFAPFKGNVHFQPGTVKVETTDAKLCGVSLPGELLVDESKVSLMAKPTAVNEPLEPCIVCLGGKKAIIDGSFSLNGELRAEGKKGDLVKSLRGSLEFDAKEGRIYRFDVVSKIFSVINVTEIYRGQLPDLAREGCAYDGIKVRATVDEGKLSLDEAVVDSRCMKMVWSGTVDFVTQTVDMVVLLAPLRTFEKLIGYVPLIGRMFDGVISVPVKVSGEIADPSIIPMSPSAIGSKLIGIMKQVLQAPLKVVSPSSSPFGNSKSPESSPPSSEEWPESHSDH